MADVARLKVIYEQGGIYLDTDVKLMVPIEKLLYETKNATSFFMFHNERFIGTGYGFGAIPKSEVIGCLLKNYEEMEFELKRGVFAQVCTHIETEALVTFYPNFIRNNKTQVFEDGTIMLSTTIWQQYLIHLGTGTWVEGGREQFENAEKKVRKNLKWKMCLRNPTFFSFIHEVFGKKAEYIYEFLVYDLLDMGIAYYIKRIVKKLVKRK